MKISIIIPTLDEAAVITDLLLDLQPMRRVGHEVILVDGNSQDHTCQLAEGLADQILLSQPGRAGRAGQLNQGIAAAQGDLYWLLHADSRVSQDCIHALYQSAEDPKMQWGRFDVRLDATARVFRLIETMMNLRSCLTGIATGDQGIFFRADACQRIGAVPEIPLMEDIALSRALRGLAWPSCLRPRLVTSARRWQASGVIKTILLMWRLRFAYWLGLDPERLQRDYPKCLPQKPGS